MTGLSPVSPSGFASFGSLLAKLGNIRAGKRFVFLGRALLDKVPSTEPFRVGLQFLVVEMKCFVEPLQSVLDLQADAERAAVFEGDSHYACLNRLAYYMKSFWAGVHL